ncbi:hypothetical protein NUW58_g10206 [Xylaria curta]|uniref:Uncharacterized protein n=1 Tax=Xylaria curta TaxID=42375 RepID=A0ACC1MNC6_9PEZI|nr:hypothetical protein NUW58_g10206 [Xylaria curta]
MHLLTPEEMELCKVSRLQPKPYLMIKEQVLKEALKGNGSLKKKQVKEICRLDSQKGGRLFDFFIDSGWIAKALHASTKTSSSRRFVSSSSLRYGLFDYLTRAPIPTPTPPPTGSSRSRSRSPSPSSPRNRASVTAVAAAIFLFLFLFLGPAAGPAATEPSVFVDYHSITLRPWQ